MKLSATISPVGESQTVAFACSELADHLASIPGIATAIGRSGGIVVGTAADIAAAGAAAEAAGETTALLPPAANDSVAAALDRKGDRLVGTVTGEHPRAVLLAVYRLLKELGFRWPDPYTTVRPSVDTLTAAFPAGIAHTPSYRHRGICIEGGVSEEHVKAIVAWAPKAGFNGYFIQFREGHTFFDRWYAPRRGRSLTREEAEAIFRRIVPEIEKRGLDFHAVGHGWTCEPFGIPGLGWVKHADPIPPETSRFLAEVGGKRELWGGIALNTSLCYSSSEVRERMARAVAEYAETNPEAGYIHVWLADGTNNNCECAECRKHRPADFYVMILNRIDELLTERQSATKIVFLAYVDLFWPPETVRFANPDRFVLMFAPITRSYSKSFTPGKPLPALPPYERNKLVFPKSVEANISYLSAWQSLFDGESFDFDYHLMWDHFLDPGYESISRVLHDDIVNLASIGLDGYMSCQVQRAFFPTGLAMTVMGETLWDSRRSFDSIAAELYEAAFGDRAAEVRDYLSKLSGLFDPVYLRGEREEATDVAVARYEEAARYLEAKRSFVESLDGASRLVLSRHRDLALVVAGALSLRAAGKLDEARARWDEAKRLIGSFEGEVLDRFDDGLYERVLGGRLFGDKR